MLSSVDTRLGVNGRFLLYCVNYLCKGNCGSRGPVRPYRISTLTRLGSRTPSSPNLYFHLDLGPKLGRCMIRGLELINIHVLDSNRNGYRKVCNYKLPWTGNLLGFSIFFLKHLINVSRKRMSQDNGSSGLPSPSSYT